MKKEELRINNTVRFESRNVHITGFDTTEDRVITNESGYNMPYFDEIHPIPLTKELLIERGFRNVDDIFWKAINLKDYVRIDLKHQSCRMEDGYKTYQTKIAYPSNLHQLENLYFALTGKELTKAATA